MNWGAWKDKLSSTLDPSSVVNFVKQIAVSEPQQLIEAEQLGIYYITNNVVAMGYPSNDTLFTGYASIESAANKHEMVSKITKFVSDSSANKIAKYLNQYHGERYMIWNLSEKSYDTTIFNDQVIEFKFPGYPSPPLQDLFTLLTAIDNWLSAHNDNIAVIHCQSGKGRTVTCIAAYLAWSKYENFSPAKSIMHVCKIMNSTIKNMTIPSQTRYLAYLTKILVNQQMPKANPITIERVILHGIPIFEMTSKTYSIESKTKIEKKEPKSNETPTKNDENSNDPTKSPSLLDFSNDKNEENKHQAKFEIGSIDDDDDDELELGQNVKHVNTIGNSDDNDHTNDHKKDDGHDKNEENKDYNTNNNNDTNESKNENEKEIEKEYEITTEKRTIIQKGIRPYIQIFKNAKLIFSSRRKSIPLKFYDESEGTIKFAVGKEIEGDILVRIRHLCENGKSKISICRFAFHTGYLESKGVIRFKKTQLDGAWNSPKFANDFWIDLLVGNANPNETPQSRMSEEFWQDITQRASHIIPKSVDEYLPPVEHRYSIGDDASIDNEIGKNALKLFKDENEWRNVLKEWNLSQYIDHFEEIGWDDVDEWKHITKSELIDIGLMEVDAQIFLNMNGNENVENKNDIDLIKRKQEENEKKDSFMDNMDESDKEVVKSMSDLMNIINDDNEPQTHHAQLNNNNNNMNGFDNGKHNNDGDDIDDEFNALNAEEHESPGKNSTIDDLEQFADGLGDLDDVEVDSDTEQNFEMLLEELNDESLMKLTNDTNEENNVDDLP